jgi:hypothetical protein
MTLRFWKWLIVVLAAAAIVLALRHANEAADHDPAVGRQQSPDARPLAGAPGPVRSPSGLVERVGLQDMASPPAG